MTITLNGKAIILDGKKVGFLSADSEGRIWYCSPRVRHLHFFRKFKAWGIAVEVLTYLQQNNVFGVKLIIDRHEILRATLQLIRFNSFEVQYEGFERQALVPERVWLKEQRML